VTSIGVKTNYNVHLCRLFKNFTEKITINATKNCIDKLITEGAKASEIMEMTPAIVLTPVLLSSDHTDRIYRVVESHSADSSLKALFKNYLQDIGCTACEAQTIVSSLVQEQTLTGRLAYALQVLPSVKFDWDECPEKVMEDHLREKNLGLEILDDNPLLFSVFKRKLYNKFRYSFQLYRPLLDLVNITFYRWQVTWFWEYLTNIPITTETYENIHAMIDL